MDVVGSFKLNFMITPILVNRLTVRALVCMWKAVV